MGPWGDAQQYEIRGAGRWGGGDAGTEGDVSDGIPIELELDDHAAAGGKGYYRRGEMNDDAAGGGATLDESNATVRDVHKSRRCRRYVGGRIMKCGLGCVAGSCHTGRHAGPCAQ